MSLTFFPAPVARLQAANSKPHSDSNYRQLLGLASFSTVHQLALFKLNLRL
jgi:hypothetical protein